MPALNSSRQARRRAVLLGRVQVREAASGFWLMSVVGLAVFSFAYYRYSLVELESRRSEVLGRQRAIAAAVGTRGLELRDQIEAWVIALGAGQLPERVSVDARLDEISRGPTIYLRMRQVDARSAEGIRKAAKGSLRDGFTSCLFVGTTPDTGQSAACTLTAQCGPGEVCSDWKVCAAPAHPYNLKLLYEGQRVLAQEWLESLEAATNEMQLRLIDLDLQSVGKHEAVAAVELARRSKYFTAVLDEEPPPSANPTARVPVGDESPDEHLQAVDHLVRVGIWDIEAAAPVAVLRLEAAGRFVRLSSGHELEPKALRAQQRQANNCAIATQVREAITMVQRKAESSVGETTIVDP